MEMKNVVCLSENVPVAMMRAPQMF
jgi:hypothetical protein